MAYLAETVLATYMANDNARYDKWENRKPLEYGSINAVMGDTKNTVNEDELTSMLTAKDRPEYISVLKRMSLSSTRNTTAPSCNFIANGSESAKYGLTWNWYENGIDMIPSEYGDNIIGYERDFRHKMDWLIDDMLTVLNTAAIANLEANKSQVNRADGNPYNYTGNTIIVPSTNQDYFFNEIDPILFMNDLRTDNLNVIASPRVMAYVNRLNAQGAGNSTNLSFQKYLNQNYHYDRFLTVPTTARDTLYMFPSGSAGMCTWIPPQAQGNGAVATDGTSWGNMDLLPGINVQVMRKSVCADNSSRAGRGGDDQKATLKDQFKFGFYYSFVNAYNSVPSVYPGTIFKAQLNK